MKLGTHGNAKFYPNMIFREVYLFIGRVVSVAVFLFMVQYLNNDMQVLALGYLCLAFLFSVKALIGYRVISKIQV
jgi:hypothetical protein